VREAQQVAVRPPVALAVLDGLVGERVDVLALIPRTDRAAQAAAPAAELLDVLREVEQVRADAADVGDRVEREPARLVVAVRGARASAKIAGSFFGARPPADGDDLAHRARPVRLDAAQDGLRVLGGQLALVGVVGAALGAEDQEAVQPRPVVNGPCVPACAVLDLRGAGDRLALRVCRVENPRRYVLMLVPS
jgi:hypothetical protein